MSVPPGLKKKIYRVAKKKAQELLNLTLLKFCLLFHSKEPWSGTGHKFLGKSNLFQRRHCIGIDDSAQHKPTRRKLCNLWKRGLLRIHMGTRAFRIPEMTRTKLTGCKICSKQGLDVQTWTVTDFSLSDFRWLLSYIQSKLLKVDNLHTLLSFPQPGEAGSKCEDVHTATCCHLVQRPVCLLPLEIAMKSSNQWCWHLFKVQTV